MSDLFGIIALVIMALGEVAMVAFVVVFTLLCIAFGAKVVLLALLGALT